MSWRRAMSPGDSNGPAWVVCRVNSAAAIVRISLAMGLGLVFGFIFWGFGERKDSSRIWVWVTIWVLGGEVKFADIFVLDREGWFSHKVMSIKPFETPQAPHPAPRQNARGADC